jgi:UDP-N-acetylglucosamine:LPS N-acetylglucosamine transferase
MAGTARQPSSQGGAIADEYSSGQRILVVSASVGAGHDGVATELTRRLRADGFRIDQLDFLELLPGPLGRALRRVYALELAVAPSTWGLLYIGLDRHRRMATAAARCADLARGPIRRAVRADCTAVVSTHPLASQVLGRLRRDGLLDAPVASYLCGMSVHQLGVSPGVDAHLSMHKIPADQALAAGATGVVVTAPAVAPGFVPRRSPEEASDARRRFGLPPRGRLALLLAGSWGVGDLERAAMDVATDGRFVPVVVCGHNTRLLGRLRRRGIGVALGWVEDMPALLRAADLVVHNAGGLSCLEALAAEVPVLAYRCLAGHGHTNVAALELAGLATPARTERDLRRLLPETQSEEFQALQRSAAAEMWGAPDPARVIAQLARPPAGSRAPSLEDPGRWAPMSATTTGLGMAEYDTDAPRRAR